MALALVIDGAYFLRRFRWSFPGVDPAEPDNVFEGVWWLAVWHLRRRQTPAVQALRETPDDLLGDSPELHRIFFYDCPPLTKKMHQPVSKAAVDWSKTPESRRRLAIHEELRSTRKIALRLGRLNEASDWRLRPASAKRLIAQPGMALTDADFEIDTKQKGVDMRLGLDVAAMAFKKQVDQIVLVAGDADFVPATKLARREGIDVVLDPMGGTPAADLFCHVDGVCSARRDEGPFA